MASRQRVNQFKLAANRKCTNCQQSLDSGRHNKLVPNGTGGWTHQCTPADLTDAQQVEVIDEVLFLAGDRRADQLNDLLDDLVAQAAHRCQITMNDADRRAIVALAYEQLRA